MLKKNVKNLISKLRADKVENEDENSCILETKKVTWSSMQLLQKKRDGMSGKTKHAVVASRLLNGISKQRCDEDH